jgi:hypothetical protein
MPAPYSLNRTARREIQGQDENFPLFMRYSSTTDQCPETKGTITIHPFTFRTGNPASTSRVGDNAASAPQKDLGVHNPDSTNADCLSLASLPSDGKKLADRPSWTVGLNTYQKSGIALTFGTVTLKHGTPYNNSCMRITTPGDPQTLSASLRCLTGAPSRTRLRLRGRPSAMRNTAFVRCTLEARLIGPETGSGLGAQFAHGRRSCPDFSASWH